MMTSMRTVIITPTMTEIMLLSFGIYVAAPSVVDTSKYGTGVVTSAVVMLA